MGRLRPDPPNRGVASVSPAASPGGAPNGMGWQGLFARTGLTPCRAENPPPGRLCRAHRLYFRRLQVGHADRVECLQVLPDSCFTS